MTCELPMNSKICTFKLSTTSISTLMVSSGIHMQVSGFDPNFEFYSIFIGFLLFLTLGIIVLVEKIEFDYYNGY